VVLFPNPLSFCDKLRTFPGGAYMCICGYMVSQSETDTLTQLAFSMLIHCHWKSQAHIQFEGSSEGSVDGAAL